MVAVPPSRNLNGSHAQSDGGMLSRERPMYLKSFAISNAKCFSEAQLRFPGNDEDYAGWNVVLDGPLNRIHGLHGFVAGYVKSHHRRILPPDDHARVPDLDVGSRTAVYESGNDRYTCYIRVGRPGPAGSPWTGIARLEFAAAPGINEVARRASLLAATLPRYAGAAHRDPRAPVNLSPVKNLEQHLSRCMGRVEHATRAAREAVHLGSAA